MGNMNNQEWEKRDKTLKQYYGQERSDKYCIKFGKKNTEWQYAMSETLQGVKQINMCMV